MNDPLMKNCVSDEVMLRTIGHSTVELPNEVDRSPKALGWRLLPLTAAVGLLARGLLQEDWRLVTLYAAAVGTIAVPLVGEGWRGRVVDELARARAKFPATDCAVVALMEELGELVEAVICRKPDEEIVGEAVQVITMAVRVAVEGDPTLSAYRMRQTLGTHTWGPGPSG